MKAVRVLLPLAAFAVLATAAAPAEPSLTKTDLFEAGKGGYALYRIPGLVVTEKGTLLAYCEARKNAKGDWGTIDVLLRRSTDGGKTWSEPAKVVDLQGKFERNPAAVAQNLGKEGEITVNSPVMIADRDGRVHFLYCVEYNRVFYRVSGDDGRTWGAPVEITATLDKFAKEYPWKALAVGPAHGIQLTSGRLLVPVWLSRGTGGHAHRPSVLSTVYSDDGGKTWQRGEVVANETDPLINPNETVAVELADSRVMLNIRSESKEHRRAVATSKDGATGWTKPAFQEELLEPICMASLVRLSLEKSGGKNRLLFANPDNLERADGMKTPGKNRDRKNLTVQLSEDEGRTWKVKRVLEPGVAGYSDLAVGKDGAVYCLYERGSADGGGFQTRALTLAKFNPEWLTEGKGPPGK